MDPQLKHGFDVMFGAISRRKAELTAWLDELQASLNRLWDAAYDEKDPTRAEKIRQLALQFCLDAGLDIPTTAVEAVEQPQTTPLLTMDQDQGPIAIQLGLAVMPGLDPAVGFLFRRFTEKLAKGEVVTSFQSLLLETYGTKWQTVRLSGQVHGSAVTAAPDTSTWQMVQATINKNIKVIDEGLRRIMFHGTHGWENLNIPLRTLSVVRIAAEHPDAWNEAKQKLIVWFGLPDSDVTYS